MLDFFKFIVILLLNKVFDFYRIEVSTLISVNVIKDSSAKNLNIVDVVNAFNFKQISQDLLIQVCFFLLLWLQMIVEKLLLGNFTILVGVHTHVVEVIFTYLWIYV